MVVLVWLAVLPSPVALADETASFDVSVSADLELIPHGDGTNYGVVARGRTVHPEPPEEGAGVAFTHGGSAASILIASSIFLEADAHGSASWSGDGPRADASGRVLAGGTLGLVTSLATDQTITVRSTLRGCHITGSVDSDLAEAAAGSVQMWVSGDPAFGLPGSEETFITRLSTRDPPGLDEFGTTVDAHCFTFVDERDIVLPGYTDPLAFDVFEVSLMLSAGGRAVSHFRDGQLFAPVALSAEDLAPPTGLPVIPLTPQDKIDAILDFYDDSLVDGSLVGEGPGGSKRGRAGALRGMLTDADALVDAGLFPEAADKLGGAVERTDGRSPPPDFVGGPAADDLAFKIGDLMVSLDQKNEPVEPIRTPNN